MDAWMLVFSAVAGVAALVSAVVAIVQAVRASAAEGRAKVAQEAAEAARDESAAMAKKATAAFVRQAEALELSNQLKLEEMKPRTWTHEHVNNQMYAVRNTSGRTIFVDRVEVGPESAANRVHLSLQPDGTYEPGDRIEYINSRVMGRNAHKLTIFWRFADEPDAELEDLIVPL